MGVRARRACQDLRIEWPAFSPGDIAVLLTNERTEVVTLARCTDNHDPGDEDDGRG